MKLHGHATNVRPQPRGPLAQIGQLLDVVVREQGPDGQVDVRVRPRRKTHLLWLPRRSSVKNGGWLVWTMGGSYKLQSAAPTGAAARAFERWSVWEADTAGKARIRVANSYRRHPIATIGYRSDKFGKKEDYEHAFGQGVHLYRPTDNRSVWVVKGGRLRLTARGIEG